ncbi:MAG: hypothetical protein ED859_00040 [Desulfuromonadales bacterium]|nr:MAG: hypothetical protein ED859_00040 [Desulfuromonadales bacterium]
MSEKGVNPGAISTIAAFKEKVPFLDKESVFPRNALRDLCVGGHLDDICSFYSSSGSSGVFSFGAETWQSASHAALGLEFLLDQHFQIFRRKTLLINCLPMGVKIATRTIPVADTSVRADVIHALIKKLADDFDQFILVGESPFLKKVIEEGSENGIPWHNLLVNVITGGEFIAENFRSYLGHLLGIDFDSPERGMILVNMGLSELGLSIFREEHRTIQLRRQAHLNRDLRYALFGTGTEVCPLVMQYFPQQTFLETVPGKDGRPELVVSTLGKNLKIPLIRYRTGDTARTMTYPEMALVLKELGRENLLPEFRLPFGMVGGKSVEVELAHGESVSANEVKEALYHDFGVASQVTGNFRLSRENGEVTLLVQLRDGFAATPGLVGKLSAALATYARVKVTIAILPYRQFPFGIEHNYERKNQYI